MKAVETDVAIIGAGTAGLSAYRAARKAGARATLIEGGPYGTTCARVGCMPSKLLIAAAEAAHAVERAPRFGVHPGGEIRIDGRAVLDRVRRERDRFVGFVLGDVERIPETDRVRGCAKFVDDHTLDVDGHTQVLAEAVVIATGSHPHIPELLADLADRLIVNDDVFELEDLPQSVAVIGPGIIGLELGQALHRLGVRVSIFGRGGRVGPIGDPEILDYAIATFREELTLEPDARIADMRRDGSRVAIRRIGSDGVSRVENYDYALVSTGRAPNVLGLGLENTSVKLGDKGVPEFDPMTAQVRCRESAPSGQPGASGVSGFSAVSGFSSGVPIFIAGDAGDFIPLLHEAADGGRIAGASAAAMALGRPIAAGLRRAQLEIVFTDPQIAIVGGGFRSLQPGSYSIGEASFENQGRARVLLRNKGLINVYAETATGRFLGAEMVAPAAEHLAHLLAWALQSRMTVGGMLDMPYYHPVLEEGLRTALRTADAKLRRIRPDPADRD